ncbi:hypothetical protein F5Y08DRAFT_301378 [Xylaria arbuscula]|nr:hypothetical protein F5Y08DRAFT_301378 [Xylaria arbuscula]
MDDSKAKKEKLGFDESLLDPRLKEASNPPARRTKANTKAASSDTVLSNTEIVAVPAPAPAQTYVSLADAWWDAFEDDIVDEHTIFPDSAYKSLDYIIASENMQGNERTWLMGVQAGIGLGIHSAREAMLNEMQNENTVFGRQIQKNASDPDPYQMRMELGRRCKTGFDRRVAYRAANRFIRNCGRVADLVVQNGLTSCLPEVGNGVIGTSMFFSGEDVARCYSISQKIDGFFGIPKGQLQPFLNTNNKPSADQPTPLIASFLRDGQSAGDIDVTQLTGTTALTSNRVVYRPTPDVTLMNREPSRSGLPGDTDVEVKVKKAPM